MSRARTQGSQTPQSRGCLSGKMLKSRGTIFVLFSFLGTSGSFGHMGLGVQAPFAETTYILPCRKPQGEPRPCYGVQGYFCLNCFMPPQNRTSSLRQTARGPHLKLQTGSTEIPISRKGYLGMREEPNLIQKGLP